MTGVMATSVMPTTTLAVAAVHKTLAASNKREPPEAGKPVLASPRESGTSPSPRASGTFSCVWLTNPPDRPDVCLRL